jgi:hypothetical protein
MIRLGLSRIARAEGSVDAVEVYRLTRSARHKRRGKVRSMVRM